METLPDIIKGLTGIFKEQEFLTQVENFHQSCLETIKIDADARRKKANSIISAIQQYDMALELLQFQINRVKKDFSNEGRVSLDNYIKDIQYQRSKLVQEKNHGI
jgi:hypothetical protein